MKTFPLFGRFIAFIGIPTFLFACHGPSPSTAQKVSTGDSQSATKAVEVLTSDSVLPSDSVPTNDSVSSTPSYAIGGSGSSCCSNSDCRPGPCDGYHVGECSIIATRCCGDGACPAISGRCGAGLCTNTGSVTAYCY